MDVFFTIIIFVLLLAFVYVLFNYKLMKTIDGKFKEVYKTKIYSDMQEFYREMESYSALLENRIGRFKKLIERQDDNLVKWQDVLDQIKKSRKGKQINEFIERSLAKEQQLIEAIGHLQMNSQDLIGQIEEKHQEARALHVEKKISPPVKEKPKAKQKPSQTEKKAAKALAPEKPAAPIAKAEALPIAPSEGDDESLSAAEELILAMPDQMVEPEQKNTQPPPSENEKTSSVLIGMLAKIGKGISPFLFGQKEKAKPKPESTKAQPISPQKNVSFEKLLSKQTPKIEARNLEPQVGPNSLISKEMSAKKSQITTLSKEELVQILDDLYDAKKRPKALKMLLMQGFKLDKIADLTEIPYSDLEATRSIYGL